MLKDKQSINMISRERKKSEMGVEREREKNKIGLEINALNYKNSANNVGELKELKLPRVQNRYNNKCKERIYKQNSLRSHKIYE